MFNVKVDKNITKIDSVKGFEILSIDSPDISEFELDKPPVLREVL